MPCMNNSCGLGGQQESCNGCCNSGCNGNDGCCSARSNPKRILLETGYNSRDAIFEMDFDGEGRQGGEDGRGRRKPTVVLDSVMVNTACLCRPIVKIQFSSLICFKGEAHHHGGGGGGGRGIATIEQSDSVGISEVGGRGGSSHKNLKVELLFKLVRICRGTEESVVETWKYLKDYEIEDDDELEVAISEPFAVNYTDRAFCGQCEYKMIVTLEDTEGEIDYLRVTKADITAFAQATC